MEQSTDVFLLLQKFRFLLAGVFCVAFVLFISALVTAVGSNSVLAKPVSTIAQEASAPNTANVVTAGAYQLTYEANRGVITLGSTIYKSCRSVTTASTESGKAVLHGSAAAVRGVGSGVLLAARGVGSGILFTVRLPGKALAAISPTHVVNNVIQPVSDQAVPVINEQTSAAFITHLNAEQQQQFAQLQAAQVVANHDLGGSAIAGDPHHGGYPAKWDNAAQDSTFDTWGMYSRECVSYTAWKVYQTFGDMPYWGGVGNAHEWPGDAQRAGIPIGSTPQVHSVAISMHGYYGHAMWVEKVSGDMIYVSQYNYDLHGHYSEMWLSASGLTYIYFR